MIGIPSSYDQYFAADPDLENNIWGQLKNTHAERAIQRQMDDGSFYAMLDDGSFYAMSSNHGMLNALIEAGKLTPSKRIDI